MLGPKPLLDNQRRNFKRFLWTLALGLVLGGLLTLLAENYLPESATRDFLTTSVAATLAFSVDLVAVNFALNPLSVVVNVLSLVGIAIVAFIARSWI